MRVLVVTSEWPSAERPDAVPFLVEQIESLRRLGVEADVFAFRGHRAPVNYVRASRAVRTMLKTKRYDLIHSHFGQAGLLTLRAPLPKVVTFHGSDLVGIMGAAGRYTTIGKILVGCSRIVARNADAVIIVSQSLAPRLPPSVAYEVIPMGVDLEVFRRTPRDDARRALGLPLEPRLALFSGRRSVPVKRFGLAAAAVDIVSRLRDVRLIHIDGQTRSDVAMYMSACDCLLVTSRHEGGPAMVKEALASDLPVASVDVGDVREWIEPIPGCAIAASDRVEDVAVALETVLSYPGGFESRSFAAPLDERLLAERIRDVYERVIARSRTR